MAPIRATTPTQHFVALMVVVRAIKVKIVCRAVVVLPGRAFAGTANATTRQ